MINWKKETKKGTLKVKGQLLWALDLIKLIECLKVNLKLHKINLNLKNRVCCINRLILKLKFENLNFGNWSKDSNLKINSRSTQSISSILKTIVFWINHLILNFLKIEHVNENLNSKIEEFSDLKQSIQFKQSQAQFWI